MFFIKYNNTMKNSLQENDYLGVDFLYRNYKRQFNGAILNEDDGMNTPLQVSTFLNTITKFSNENILILVICPEEILKYWSYHLTVDGNFNVKYITSASETSEVLTESTVHLLSVSDIKICDDLLDVEYFSIVVDYFDQICNKLIFKRLNGKFNIGVTYRNFYLNPDDKLQWTMLNWSNPGCAGKLNEFYKINEDHVCNFRNVYRNFWLRITWNFSSNFSKLSKIEKQEYERKIRDFIENWNRNIPHKNKRELKRKVQPRKIENDKNLRKKIKKSLPIMDENPILESIKKNFESDTNLNSASRTEDDDSSDEDVLLSVIKNKAVSCEMNFKNSDDFLKSVFSSSNKN